MDTNKKYKSLIQVKNDSGCCIGKPFIILYETLEDKDISTDTIYFTIEQENENYTIKKHYKEYIIYSVESDNCHIFDTANLADIFRELTKVPNEEVFKR